MFDINLFSPSASLFKRREVNRLELSALFGSVKYFKYLMINGDEIKKDVCKFAITGGNNEIVHLCEQNV